MNKLIQLALLLLVAAAAGAGAYYLLSGPRGQVIQGDAGHRSLPQTESEFRDSLAEFRMGRHDTVNAIKSLKRELALQVKKLKDKGVNSSADLNDADEDVGYAFSAVKEIMNNIKAREKDVEDYDKTISALVAQLDHLRQKYISDSAEITPEEYMALKKIEIDLKEKLIGEKGDLFEEEEDRKMFDDLMAEPDEDE